MGLCVTIVRLVPLQRPQIGINLAENVQAKPFLAIKSTKKARGGAKDVNANALVFFKHGAKESSAYTAFSEHRDESSNIMVGASSAWRQFLSWEVDFNPLSQHRPFIFLINNVLYINYLI